MIASIVLHAVPIVIGSGGAAIFRVQVPRGSACRPAVKGARVREEQQGEHEQRAHSPTAGGSCES